MRKQLLETRGESCIQAGCLRYTMALDTANLWQPGNDGTEEMYTLTSLFSHSYILLMTPTGQIPSKVCRDAVYIVHLPWAQTR